MRSNHHSSFEKGALLERPAPNFDLRMEADDWGAHPTNGHGPRARTDTWASDDYAADLPQSDLSFDDLSSDDVARRPISDASMLAAASSILAPPVELPPLAPLPRGARLR